jgi:hypothetical protein
LFSLQPDVLPASCDRQAWGALHSRTIALPRFGRPR